MPVLEVSLALSFPSIQIMIWTLWNTLLSAAHLNSLAAADQRTLGTCAGRAVSKVALKNLIHGHYFAISLFSLSLLIFFCRTSRSIV